MNTSRGDSRVAPTENIDPPAASARVIRRTNLVLPAGDQRLDKGNHSRVAGGQPAAERQAAQFDQVGDRGGDLSAQAVVGQVQLPQMQVAQFGRQGAAQVVVV